MQKSVPHRPAALGLVINGGSKCSATKWLRSFFARQSFIYRAFIYRALLADTIRTLAYGSFNTAIILKLNPVIEPSENVNESAAGSIYLFEPRQSIFPVEFVYPTGRVEYLLLTCVERVANRAYLDLETLVGKRGLCLEVVSATAFYGNFMVGRVYAGFHRSESCPFAPYLREPYAKVRLYFLRYQYLVESYAKVRIVPAGKAL